MKNQTNEKNESPEQISVVRNRKRSNVLSSLKRKNLKLSDQMHTYTKSAQLSQEQLFHMQRLSREVQRCANISLYRDENTENGLTLINSFMCDCKLCFICNQARQKATRRKYLRWFADNASIVEVKNPANGRIKYVTRTQAEGKKYNNWPVVSEPAYDLMHLTLTVPHTAEHGWNDDHYFFDKIAKLYWLMRKDADWNRLVFGGEYGIEATKNANGLHIHIHSLLLVRRESRNRNQLHAIVLRLWNKLSVNKFATREELTDGVIQKILKSNSMILEEEARALHPKGATLINLEVIYTIDKETGKKVRSTEFGSREMMIAVMETISYHFEPQCFDKEDKTFDFPLMAEIMPRIYRKALYKKFGCLHGESSLNVSAGDPDELLQEYEVESSMIDQDTGEIRQDAGFFVINPAHVYHHPDNDLKPVVSNTGKRQMIRINALSTREAIDYMSGMIHKDRTQKPN